MRPPNKSREPRMHRVNNKTNKIIIKKNIFLSKFRHATTRLTRGARCIRGQREIPPNGIVCAIRFRSAQQGTVFPRPQQNSIHPKGIMCTYRTNQGPNQGRISLGLLFSSCLKKICHWFEKLKKRKQTSAKANRHVVVVKKIENSSKRSENIMMKTDKLIVSGSSSDDSFFAYNKSHEQKRQRKRQRV